MPSVDESHGVYYERSDYAGFWRRLFIDLIDGIVASLVFIGALSAQVLLLLPDTALQVHLALAYPLLGVVGLAYFVGLKWWRLTVGYWICRARLVTLEGKPVGPYALIVRSLFAILGPVSFFVDIAWIANDEHRQALRDKFTHTYVVKQQAEPAGDTSRRLEVVPWGCSGTSCSKVRSLLNATAQTLSKDGSHKWRPNSSRRARRFTRSSCSSSPSRARTSMATAVSVSPSPCTLRH